ncbi:hypothetical protein CGJ16_25040 [Vibrio parahaemolyticus]|nr:hypothetical protein CGJ16_25040 [Vibrio parahaemolyticus]
MNKCIFPKPVIIKGCWKQLWHDVSYERKVLKIKTYQFSYNKLFKSNSARVAFLLCVGFSG